MLTGYEMIKRAAFREGRERLHTTQDCGLPHLIMDECKKKQKEQ